MGFRVNTNTPALASQRTLRNTTAKLEKNVKHLASGSRITEAGDDAAGLAISEKVKSVIRSAQQAQRNTNDSVSMIQVAEGGMNEVQNMLTRLREISIQTASDTVGNAERAMSDLEYQQLKLEIQRIAESTKYNGADLLNGQGGVYDFQVDIRSANAHRISFAADESNVTVDGLGIEGLQVSEKSSAQQSLTTLDNAIEQVSRQRSNLGSIQARLVSSSNNLSVYEKSQSDANSRIRDADYASETAEMAKNSILQDAGTQVQASANNFGSAALKLLS
ncbi:MAG: flagellin FliC [Bacteriovoracaceae bacterium]|nr:flagellin FliC [Bacteriovoracaceae bacterium]